MTDFFVPCSGVMGVPPDQAVLGVQNYLEVSTAAWFSATLLPDMLVFCVQGF